MRMPNRLSTLLLASALVVALLCAGCGPRALKTMKDAHQQGRYAEVADRAVDCDAGDDRCNQMHLLKGDACYVLGRRAEAAEQDSTARVRFECAETHLGTGIEQTEANAADWTVAGKDRTQWYTNRAESLRQLQDLQSGDAARTLSKKLLDFGQAFREIDPDVAAPHFYIATARYALVQPQLIDAPPGDADVCDELNGIRTVLDEAPSGPSDVQDNVESLRRQINSQRMRLNCAP